MEEENHQPWRIAANWIVADGSLQNTVFFESPIHPLPEEPNDRHPFLILNPSPSHSKPCEITISFEQSHEVQRVYVRSTARVYEIYYARRHGGENEYLCTVRCGECSTETVNPPEEITKNGSSHSSNEDGWVEVKNPLLDDGANSSSTPILPGGKTNRNAQVFYEATAEITDAYPCISLTLRLLSIQTKGSVCAEEIYIFAEPAESTDSGSPSEPMGSAGGSLLTMLVPSLLQLSKPESSRFQNKSISGIEEKHDYQERGLLKAPSPPDLDQKLGGSGSKAELLVDEKKLPDSSHFENVLEKLVAKVDKIEAFCSRMEEKMLEPLNRIETRLQKVERQLDELTVRSQLFESKECSRFRAPEFSNDCSESINSDYVDENGETNQGENNSESMAKNIPVTRRCLSVNDAIASALAAFSATTSTVTVSGPEICPGLIVTVPEFSDDDNHEDGASYLTEKATCKGDAGLCSALLVAAADDIGNMLLSTSAQETCGRAEDLHMDSYEVIETDFWLTSSFRTVDSSISHSCSAQDMDGQSEATDMTPASMVPATEAKLHDAEDNFHSNTHLTGDVFGPDFELFTQRSLLRERSQSRLNIEQSILDVGFVSEANWNVGLPLEALLGDLPVSEIETNNGELNNSGVNYQTTIEDVEFVPEANWNVGLPLEALLGDVTIPKIEANDRELKNSGDDQPLLEVEEIKDVTEEYTLFLLEGEELKGNTATNRFELYPDLI